MFARETVCERDRKSVCVNQLSTVCVRDRDTLCECVKLDRALHPLCVCVFPRTALQRGRHPVSSALVPLRKALKAGQVVPADVGTAGCGGSKACRGECVCVCVCVNSPV